MSPPHDGSGRSDTDILFLSQLLPYPLSSGARVRAYGMLRALADLGRVHLLCFVREDDPPEAVAHLRSFCAEVIPVPVRRSKMRDAWAMVRALATRGPFLIVRDQQAAMIEAIDTLCAASAFDVVHVDQLWMAPYAARVPRAKRVIDVHNVAHRTVAQLAKIERRPIVRTLLRREIGALARFERALHHSFDTLLFVCEPDRKALRALLRPNEHAAFDRNGTVLPITLDTTAQPRLDTAPDSRRVTFIGPLNWPPNSDAVHWFAREVWPLVRSAVPGARFTVIGKAPGSAVRRLATDGSAGIDVCGFVDDPRELLADSSVLVAPLRAGGGMRVKILDAWAWGLPVVSTTIGAEGIHVSDGDDIWLADDAAEFAEAVISLLEDPVRRAKMAAAGRHRLEREYELSATCAALARLYGWAEGDAHEMETITARTGSRVPL